MCIAIPNRVLSIKENLATVELGDGSTTSVDISLVDIKEGEYVIVQNGFAIETLSPEEAEETLDIWRSMLEQEQKG
ncbi:MAG: HypC/HybG/HupF family hydrogenase formation chaperone [Candidatus Kariarchaeaceae archaeon]|jgi:hydrogenase expression/formation protein HypC